MDWEKFDNLLTEYGYAFHNELWHEERSSNATYMEAVREADKAKEDFIAFIKEQIKD